MLDTTSEKGTCMEDNAANSRYAALGDESFDRDWIGTEEAAGVGRIKAYSYSGTACSRCGGERDEDICREWEAGRVL